MSFIIIYDFTTWSFTLTSMLSKYWKCNHDNTKLSGKGFDKCVVQSLRTNEMNGYNADRWPPLHHTTQKIISWAGGVAQAVRAPASASMRP
jgi:hypothetical protein